MEEDTAGRAGLSRDLPLLLTVTFSLTPQTQGQREAAGGGCLSL